jgi:hypothetical protein
MASAPWRTVPGERHVDGFLAQHTRVALGPQDRLAVVEGGLDGLTCLIDALARIGLVLLGQASDLPAGQQLRRVVTEMGRLDRGQRVEVGG